MAPFVSVVLRNVSVSYTKLFLPIEALKVLEDETADWIWFPDKEDAICSVSKRSLRDMCDLRGTVAQLKNGAWDFRF